MSKLKKMRISQKLSQPQMAKVLQSAEKRIRGADISRYEHGVCLPTPAQLRLICQLLEADPDDIYSREEMDLAGCIKNAPLTGDKTNDEPTDYKLTVRLPKASCKGLNTKLHTCGYPSQKAWIMKCLDELNEEYKKAAPVLAHQKAAEKNTQD